MFFLQFSFVCIFFIWFAKGVRVFLFEYKVSCYEMINFVAGFYKRLFALYYYLRLTFSLLIWS